MDILISMITALIVVIAYCMGVWTGSRFLCRRVGENGGASSCGKHMKTVIADLCGCEGTYGTGTENNNGDGSTGNEMTEEEKRIIKEQQKALEQCMSYSVDMAYGNIKLDR